MDSTNDYRAVDALQTSMKSVTKPKVSLQLLQRALAHNLDTYNFLAEEDETYNSSHSFMTPGWYEGAHGCLSAFKQQRRLRPNFLVRKPCLTGVFEFHTSMRILAHIALNSPYLPYRPGLSHLYNSCAHPTSPHPCYLDITPNTSRPAADHTIRSIDIDTDTDTDTDSTREFAAAADRH